MQHRSRHERWDDSIDVPTEMMCKSRGTTRYSFASNLFDLAFNRGGKRRRPNSVTNNIGVNDEQSHGLDDIPESLLAASIEPILIQLQELDAEELLSLTRIVSGGATLREG
jgi:hypothetical protein